MQVMERHKKIIRRVGFGLGVASGALMFTLAHKASNESAEINQRISQCQEMVHLGRFNCIRGLGYSSMTEALGRAEVRLNPDVIIEQLETQKIDSDLRTMDIFAQLAAAALVVVAPIGIAIGATADTQKNER